MSIDVHRRVRSNLTRPGVRPPTGAVLASMAVGAVAAALMTMLVLPGATEGVTAGATLLGFGLGWAMLRVRSSRTPSRRSRWRPRAQSSWQRRPRTTR